MYLSKIFIFNYRSAQVINLNLDQNNPNIYIGLNDSGKSTILNAFDLLLNDKAKYNSLTEGNYKSDLSNTSVDMQEINKLLLQYKLPNMDLCNNCSLILGKLVYDGDEADEFENINLTTPLKWSIESNNDNELWIAKKCCGDLSQTYLLGNESVSPLELWSASQRIISDQIIENNVSKGDIQNENRKGRFSNFEKIRAIYNKLDCSIKWIEYKSGKNDKDIFPSFSLFDWNTSLDEVIQTANVIMKDEIDEHLNPLKEKAIESAKQAEKAINARFGELSNVIKEVAKDVENVSSKLYFDVKEKISDIMVTKTYSDGPIHLENQGEGLKRQIWFSLIKAKADETKNGINKFIWAFDEPETHLYPGAQREFFDSLNKISNGNVQTLISTHSTIFIDKSKLNKINSVKQNEFGYTEINFCKDVDSIFSALNVKNSDFLFYDKFLIVEGDTEQYLIPQLYEIYTENTLISHNIQLLNIQGKNKWNANKIIIDKILGDFKKSDEQVIYLFDNDMSFEMGATQMTNNMFFVGKQDIEDSISDDVWVEILNNYYKDENLVFIKDEISELKNEIPSKFKCASHEKFYTLLKKLIKDKCIVNDIVHDCLKRIPSKGSESADFILDFLVKKEQIPENIKDAFDKLKVI
jgi:predicted ATP-dependent endonuclease of OLD family